MAKDVWGWWAGANEEFFAYGGPFPTRDEAIDAGRDGADGEGFWIVEAVQQEVRFSGEALIEAQYFENDDYFGEDADPDRLGESSAADAELQALLDVWTEKWRHTFVTPNMFAAQRSLEFVKGEPDEASS